MEIKKYDVSSYNKDEINEIIKTIDHHRVEGMYNIVITALTYQMDDLIYNIFCEWHYIDILCNIFVCDKNKDTDTDTDTDRAKLINIIRIAKQCKKFKYYPSWNNEELFDPVENLRDIFELNDMFDMLDMFD